MAERASGARYLSVGVVRKPHGIRGELLIGVETDRPESVFRPGRELHLGSAAGVPTGKRLTIGRVRPFKDGYLVVAKEFPSRNAEMEALRGHTLLIPEAEAAPPAEDEVFYHELAGMRVVVGEAAVGTVREVMETPGGDLLVVKREEGKDLLVPLVREMVAGIDREARVVTIDPPEGLLDL